MTQLKIPLNIFLQHHNTDYSLAGLYCASIWTVSDGLHSSNMACSAVTEVKSTPLNWNRNIQLKTLRNNQSKNHQRNITLHIQIMFPFTDFWESFNFIALVLRDSGCLKCLNLKFCAENCRAPGQNWSHYQHAQRLNAVFFCAAVDSSWHAKPLRDSHDSTFSQKWTRPYAASPWLDSVFFSPISFNLKMAPFPFFPQFVFLTRWIFNK